MIIRDAIKVLQGKGINPSIQRIAIMDYLLSHHTHPTVEDVYVALNKKIPTLSKTTVYNTLRLFAQCGVAQMLTIDEKKLCFDGDTKPHAHFMCNVCGHVYDVKMPPSIVDFQPSPCEFDVKETQVYYKGICKKCKQEVVRVEEDKML